MRLKRGKSQKRMPTKKRRNNLKLDKRKEAIKK